MQTVTKLLVFATMIWIPVAAGVHLVEPGHTLTKLVDTCTPLHPSQDLSCFGRAEGVGIDPASGTLYVQLHWPQALANTSTSCIVSVSPSGVVTEINTDTGFSQADGGADLLYDAATDRLITYSRFDGSRNVLRTVLPDPPGTVGTYGPGPFDGLWGFGAQFSEGVGGSDVPVGHLLFSTLTDESLIYSVTPGGSFVSHGVLTSITSSEIVIQPDGDWVLVPQIGSIRALSPVGPDHVWTLSPTGLSIQLLDLFAELESPVAGARGTVCDLNGDLYVASSNFLFANQGKRLWRINESLTNAFRVVETDGDQKLQDMVVGPSTSGDGRSVYFTVYDSVTFCNQVWELSVPECVEPDGPVCESAMYGAADRLKRVDPYSGLKAQVGIVGFEVGAIDFDIAMETLYAVGTRQGVCDVPAGSCSEATAIACSSDADCAQVPVLLTIGTISGSGTEIGPLVNTDGAMPFDLSFHDDEGRLLMLAGSPTAASSLFEVDVTTGLATEIGDTLTGIAGGALITSPQGELLLANDDEAGGGGLWSIDPATGAASLVTGPLTYSGFAPDRFSPPTAADVDPLSGVTYVLLPQGKVGPFVDNMGTLDLSSGEVTFLSLTETYDSIAITLPDRDCDGLDNPDDPCPDSPNPGGGAGAAIFGQTVLASSTKQDFVWSRPAPYGYVEGDFTVAADVGLYSGSVFATGFDSGASHRVPLVPAAGAGHWYLFRPDCSPASWISGGGGELPGARDADLP